MNELEFLRRELFFIKTNYNIAKDNYNKTGDIKYLQECDELTRKEIETKTKIRELEWKS